MGTSENLLLFTDANFDEEVLKSELPVLVDITATWCGPCKLLAPIVEKLADELAGEVKVGKLDLDASPGVAARYGIRSVPTVIAFRNGEIVGQHAGLTKRETLLKLLEKTS